MSKRRKLRLANGHWRKKGNTPWKWFMDKAAILKKKYNYREENELLKAYIEFEVEDMAAYAPFDELGNKMRYVQRAFLTVGHIIPKLEKLKKEVEITCLPQPRENSKDEV